MTVISPARRLVFVHIPKCGGSSIEAEFALHRQPGDMIVGFDGDDQHRRTMAKTGLAKHMAYVYLARALGPGIASTYQFCAIVREPRRQLESFYKYGQRTLHELLGQGGVPSAADISESRLAALRVRLSAADAPLPQWLRDINRGVIIDAMQSESFEDFLDRVLDARWERYQTSYLIDGSGARAVQHVLRLEEPIAIRRFFKTRIGKDFTLRHNNRSVETRLSWPADRLRRFLDIAAPEYAALGYALPA